MSAGEHGNGTHAVREQSREQARVLVVDDDSLSRGTIRQILEARGHLVTTAASAGEAAALLAESDYDAAVVDLFMPEANGVEVLRLLASEAPETPAIIFTGVATLASAVDCLRAGAFDYIEKRDVARLPSAVERAVTTRRRRAALALAEASQLVFSVQDRAELPRLIVESACRLIQADDASLMLPAHDGALYVSYSNGRSPAVQSQERVALGKGIAGRVALERRPVLLSHDQGEDAEHRDATSAGNVKSSIVYPLCSGERLAGVLTLNRHAVTAPFRQHDLQKVSVLAAQATLALEVVGLLRQLAAAEKFRALGQLMGGVAHEINNPITFVASNIKYATEYAAGLSRLFGLVESGAAPEVISQALADHGGSGELRQVGVALVDAQDGATRVLQVVSDMRALAHGGEQERVAEVESAVRVALRMTAAELRTSCEVELDLAPRLCVAMGPTRLSQVFVNLFANAAFAMRASKRERGLLTVTSRRDGAAVLIAVSDTGTGIAPADRMRLFEPFFTTKPRDVGTGLGLSTCLDLVRQSGGTITVDSVPGASATFTVRLPCESPREEERSRQAAVAGPAKPRALLVDDEAAIGRSLQRILAGTFEAHAVTSAAEALQVLEADSGFAVILCDLLMPTMTGMCFFDEAIRRWPELSTRFVFMTGCATHSDVQRFVARVPNPVIGKPFDMKELQRVLDSSVDAYKRVSR